MIAPFAHCSAHERPVLTSAQSRPLAVDAVALLSPAPYLVQGRHPASSGKPSGNRRARTMRAAIATALLAAAIPCSGQSGPEPIVAVAGAKKENNLVSRLLEVSSIRAPSGSFTFARPGPGWTFIAATCEGKGSVKIGLEGDPRATPSAFTTPTRPTRPKQCADLGKGEHRLSVQCSGQARVNRLVVKAIPELIHCGLGFDPAIKSYRALRHGVSQEGHPAECHHADRPQQHRAGAVGHRRLASARGRRFVAEVGINGQAKTADEHFQYWTGTLGQRRSWTE